MKKNMLAAQARYYLQKSKLTIRKQLFTDKEQAISYIHSLLSACRTFSPTAMRLHYALGLEFEDASVIRFGLFRTDTNQYGISVSTCVFGCQPYYNMMLRKDIKYYVTKPTGELTLLDNKSPDTVPR